MSGPQLELRGGDTLLVSPSQLADLQLCPRRWHFKQMWRRVRAAAAPARDGGKAYDAAMNIRYTRMGAATPDAACQAAMEAAIHTAYQGIELPLDEWRTPARYVDLVRAYNEHYGEEPWDVLGVQLPFEVHLGDLPAPPAFWIAYWQLKYGNDWSTAPDFDGQAVPRIKVRLHGILDLLLRHRDTGLVLVCDTKTASQWGPGQQSSYDNHGQMLSYAWAVPEMRRQLGDAVAPPWSTMPDAVHGCMVNACVLRKPYAREQSAAKAAALPRTEFHRFVVTYSQERLQEWRTSALWWVEQALGCVARDEWPQNWGSCASIFGRPCSYMDVCCAPKEQRAMILESDLYTDYKRGPLADAAAEEGK